jgi:hypothetical protein
MLALASTTAVETVKADIQASGIVLQSTSVMCPSLEELR